MTTQLKIIKNYIKLTPLLRTSRGTDEAVAENTQSVNSSIEIYVSYYISCTHGIFIFFCILNTTIMVKTCDYLHLNNEIHFTKPL